MIATITCPQCCSESKMSLLTGTFQGAFRCWKCKNNFYLEVNEGQVIVCNSITEEQFEEQLALDKLKKKFLKSEDDASQ